MPRQLRLGVQRADRPPTAARSAPLDEDGGARRRRALPRGPASKRSRSRFLWSIVNDPRTSGARPRSSREELPDVHVVCSRRHPARDPRVGADLGDRAERVRRCRGSADTSARSSASSERRRSAPAADHADQRRLRARRRAPARPVDIARLGPGGGARRGAALRRAAVGRSDLITVDMGGTSFDVCLIHGGRAAMSRDIQVERRSRSASRRRCPLDRRRRRHIAWVDAGGALRVGPRSAGAAPGPACYGLGGAEPTVTDANVVLGYLSTRPRSSAAGGSSTTTSRGAVDRSTSRRAARARRGRGGRGDPARRQREHGRRDPRRLGRARHRPARLHARLRRRRGRPARGRAGARARDARRSSFRARRASSAPSA